MQYILKHTSIVVLNYAPIFKYPTRHTILTDNFKPKIGTF